MKIVALCGIGMLSLVACIGCRSRAFATSDSTSVIRAQSIQLVDSSGATRMSMTVDAQSGAAAISIFEANNTNPRILLGVKGDGLDALEFRDSKGNKRAEMNVASSGEVRLSVIDDALKGGAVLASANGKTALVFNDDQPKVRVAVGLAPSAQPSVTIYDEAGKVSWNAPVSSNK